MASSALPVVLEELQSGKHLKNQLAAAVRSINWSYAIFWSISRSHPGVLTWKDGFYNDETKTMKIANSMELTAEQLALKRSEQLRELYESLQSRRSARPIASLSPEDLGDTEWYYVGCMTYAFRPGQGLPGRSFASNEHVWLCNANLADSKSFRRALLAKSASIQTLVCIPVMGGVLELGTSASVPQDPTLLNRVTTSFKELNFPMCPEDPLTNNTGDANNNAIMLDYMDQNAMETIIAEGGNLEQMTKDFDDFYELWDELDAQSLLQDRRGNVDGSSLVAAPEGNKDDAALSSPGDSSRASSFIAWTIFSSDELAVRPVIGEAQKLLKKVVAGRPWTNNGGESIARATLDEPGIKKHVMTERKRREKLNEMFLVLKKSVPTIRKMDKASILAETIAYLKELERRVKELESRREPISTPGETRPRCHYSAITAMRNPATTKRKKASELNGDMETEHHWVLSKDGPSNVSVTVMGTEVLIEVQCRWKELLMTRVFDTIKSLDLDVLSVEASTPNCLMELKIRAQFASSAAIPPGTIREALWTAIANHSSESWKC